MPQGPIVAFPDHITTAVELPKLRALSKSLFALGLGPGWPLAEQPGFATAGIRIGNLNLEICTVDPKENPLSDWLTFEPVDLDTLADALTDKGIKYDPFDAMVAGGQSIYTRVGLPGLATEQTALQLCHTFYPTRTTGPDAPKNSAGIVRVRSVNVALDDVHRKVLDSLLGSTASQDTIEFSEGPELRITSAAELRVEGMTVECNDPETAAKVLSEAGLERLDDSKVAVGSLTMDLIHV